MFTILTLLLAAAIRFRMVAGYFRAVTGRLAARRWV
jgi:hypothetical protein